MPAVVMKVTKAEKHPNADTLFVYEMTSVENIKTQVVANSTNLYEVGDLAVVATSGSKLKDGTYIEETKVRGVVSSGMALGKTDAPLGTNLTEEHCLPVYHISWPDIESLFNVRKGLAETGTERTVLYVSKIKLDGTNAAVQVHPNGDLIVQSRSDIITPAKDNAGFATWVEANKEYFKSLATSEPFVIFGEWCGRGIQKRCSISQIDRKVFCVFAVQWGGSLDINPISIRTLLIGREDTSNEFVRTDHKDIFVLPIFGSVVVDYSNEEKLKNAVEQMNAQVKTVEECDPFVAEYFDVEGLGEGLVFYPVTELNLEANGFEKHLVKREEYKELVFKAKGEKHAVVKTKAPVQIDPEVAKNIEDFVQLFVTENRLEQIAQKVGGFDSKKTGEFLKGFAADVMKESHAELQASKMTWKDVANPVSTAARNWWLKNCNTV